MHLPSALQRLQHKPVLALIAINLVVGLFTFRDYGFSLDEPLFYGYADALGYAYSPTEWLSGEFDLERAYGPSAWDHRNRGPAYILLARGPAHWLQAAGLPQDEAWHLVNFIAFQIGVYFFYVLCRRWMSPWGALAGAALFTTQPVIWEHAFINPKDPPFMVFFLAALELGFQMADRLAADERLSRLRLLRHTVLPGVLLGLTTSIRVLGPLAAALVVVYFLSLRRPARLHWLIPYGMVAGAAMILTWPYLWEGPVEKFLETLTFMSDNPTRLQVFFYGSVYRADELPRRYLPILFLYTLTEPVWPLALAGGLVALWRGWQSRLEWRSLLATCMWFVLPFVYVLWKRPPMYDGFRHFLFILPPVFALAGLAVDGLSSWLRAPAVRVAILAALLSPGLLAGLRLHPYEYTYYNSFVGGTDRASFDFETDYWLTCYKEALGYFDPSSRFVNTLVVPREGYIARFYALEGVEIVDASQGPHSPVPGEYVLLAARANPLIQRYRGQTELTLIGRDNAIFCVIEKRTE
jgi:hypothetical protein